MNPKELEFLKESVSSVYNPLDETLRFYHIGVDGKGSFLCPFHSDKHLGSCRIIKGTQKARCFACVKTFDAFEVIKYKENVNYANALKFFWCDVLGNTVPSMDIASERITGADIKALGMKGAYGRELLAPVNQSFYRESEDCVQEGERYTVTEPLHFPSVISMEDKEAARYILKRLADEAFEREQDNPALRNLVAKLNSPV